MKYIKVPCKTFTLYLFNLTMSLTIFKKRFIDPQSYKQKYLLKQQMKTSVRKFAILFIIFREISFVLLITNSKLSMSATCQPQYSNMSATFQSNVSHISAKCPPHVSHL